MTLCNLLFLILVREAINISITKTKLTDKLKYLISLTPRNLNANYCLLFLLSEMKLMQNNRINS
jgi:hypothetical protein